MTKSRVDVHVNELKKAYRAFRRHAPDVTHDKCCCLDAFYAVECGISALYLLSKGKYTTEAMINVYKNHNINALIEQCDNNPGIFLPQSIRLARGRQIHQDSISSYQLHSALRYGADIPRDEWIRCANILKSIISWIDRTMER